MSNTAQAESFVVVEETAVAKGIRRVSAVTAEAAVQARRAGERPIPIAKDTGTLVGRCSIIFDTASADELVLSTQRAVELLMPPLYPVPPQARS